MKFFLPKGIFLVLGLVLALILGYASGFASTPVLDSRNPATSDVRLRISQIEQNWQQQYQNYLGIESSSASLSADQINATLARLGNETNKRLALIYIFPNPSALELVLVIPGTDPIRHTLPDVSRATLLAVAQTFKSNVSRPLPVALARPSAQQLYEWMIAPLKPSLQDHGIDTLVFCVGAGLRSLPFAALYDGRQYLIEQYSVGLIPAFNLINANYRKLQSMPVLAMGASEFENLAALPAVPVELSTILQHGWQGSIFLNQDFTLDNLQNQLESQAFGIVHLATHAEFKPGEPDQSYIQLWQDEQLTLDDLRQLDWSNLPVELLVLSACQTALGDEEAELGFAGLSFQSGVKSSLASLWFVSDLGTLALMREFYQQLANPEVTTKAEALRRAQLTLLRRQVQVQDHQLSGSGDSLRLPDPLTTSGPSEFSNPYYWASFTLVGSPW